MSKQVLSIEQMQHLKELGIDTSKGTIYYWEITNGEYDLSTRRYVFKDGISFVSLKLYPYIPSDDVLIRSVKCIAAFTLQDILDFLPKVIIKEEHCHYFEMCRNENRYYVAYYWLDNPLVELENEEFIDASYEMLCWVVKNGYFKQ